MTGLDCLKQEMLKRGLTKQQTESKILAVVLDIIANSDGEYLNLYEVEQTALQRESEAFNHVQHELYEGREKIAELDEEERVLEAHINELRKEIAATEEKMLEAETPEARDALRKAAFLKHSVDVESKYDNTAYIISLGAILSGGACDPIATERKINPKLFEPHGEEQKKYAGRRY